MATSVSSQSAPFIHKWISFELDMCMSERANIAMPITWMRVLIYIYIVYVNLVSNLSNTNCRMATSPQVELKTIVFFSAF